MTTPRDIIDLALHDAGIVGVGQTPLAEDENRAFTRLNWMLGEWASKRWMVWHLLTTSKVSTGAQSYTVGPASDFAIDPRPDRIDSAFVRQLTSTPINRVDTPLEIIGSREDYNLIAAKTQGSYPYYLFLDTDYPVGTLYPWPVPQASLYEIFISVRSLLTQFTNLSQTISLPAVYYSAILNNLGVILRDAYDLPPKPVQIKRALATLNTIRNSNAQIPLLLMPSELTQTGGAYNIYSDQTR